MKVRAMAMAGGWFLAGVAGAQGAAPASPGNIPAQVLGEMQQAEQSCRENHFYSSLHDCKCVADRFDQERMQGDLATDWKEVYWHVNEEPVCPNGPGIVKYVYVSCAGYYKSIRKDYVAFCKCAADDTAHRFVDQPAASLFSEMRREALQKCGIAGQSKYQ